MRTAFGKPLPEGRAPVYFTPARGYFVAILNVLGVASFIVTTNA